MGGVLLNINVYCTQSIMVSVLLRKMEVSGDRESIIIGFTSTYIISAFHNFDSRPWRGVLDTAFALIFFTYFP